MDNPTRSSLRNSGYSAEKPEQFRRVGPTPTHKGDKFFWTRSRKEALAAWLFILPDTIGLLIFVAIPMVLALSLGFFEVNGFGGYHLVPDGVLYGDIFIRLAGDTERVLRSS
jgi:hypothetical protein